MTTQQKFDKARLIETEASNVVANFITKQLQIAETAFADLNPFKMSVGRETLELRMTENSPSFTLFVQQDWNWDNPGFTMQTSMSSCSGAKAADFLAMAKFATKMELVINQIESNIQNDAEKVMAERNQLWDQAAVIKTEARKESTIQAQKEAAQRLYRFNTDILNNGVIELEEPISVQLTADWKPKIKSIEVMQKPRQSSFTVIVDVQSRDGRVWKDETRVCGSFKKNVMNLFK